MIVHMLVMGLRSRKLQRDNRNTYLGYEHENGFYFCIIIIF